MARIRTIKPEFPQSETIGSLSRDARLLFIQLWTVADDFGRARASSRVLASLLYPYDEDAPSLIRGWLDELEAKTCIRRYEVEEKLYLDIPNWLKHQKIDRPTPSKLPEFRESLASPREPSMDIRRGSVREGKGEDRDREGTGTGTRPDSPSSALEGKSEENIPARALASALPSGALACAPSSYTKLTDQEANDYRSPPRTKPDTPLQPLPEKLR